MSRFFLVALVSCVLMVPACSDDNGDPPKPDMVKADQNGGGGDAPQSCGATTLLPADNAVGDFTQDGTPQEASDLTALTALINGGSEKYTQTNKFICMALIKYKSGTQAHTLELWLFDETDQAGAEAAYQATNHPDDTDLASTVGDASRGHENAISDVYQADMRKGQYLARVIADKVAGKDDAIALLTAVASGI